jgi:hypothetical protein
MLLKRFDMEFRVLTIKPLECLMNRVSQGSRTDKRRGFGIA